MADVVNVATPPEIVAEPTVLPVTTKSTVSPSGGGPAIDDRVAVNVTACPSTEGFCDEVTVPVILGIRSMLPLLVESAITPASLT